MAEVRIPGFPGFDHPQWDNLSNTDKLRARRGWVKKMSEAYPNQSAESFEQAAWADVSDPYMLPWKQREASELMEDPYPGFLKGTYMGVVDPAMRLFGAPQQALYAGIKGENPFKQVVEYLKPEGLEKQLTYTKIGGPGGPFVSSIVDIALDPGLLLGGWGLSGLHNIKRLARVLETVKGAPPLTRGRALAEFSRGLRGTETLRKKILAPPRRGVARLTDLAAGDSEVYKILTRLPKEKLPEAEAILNRGGGWSHLRRLELSKEIKKAGSGYQKPAPGYQKPPRPPKVSGTTPETLSSPQVAMEGAGDILKYERELLEHLKKVKK